MFPLVRSVDEKGRMFLVRSATKLISGYICLKVILKIWRKIGQWKKRVLKARQLPALPIPEELKNSVDVMGPLIRGLPKNVPFGIDGISSNYVKILYNIASTYKAKHKLICFWLINPRVISLPLYQVIILDYDLMKKLSSPEIQPYLKKSQTYGFLEDLIGKSMVVESGPTWHNQRVIADKAFARKYLDRFPSMIDECCANFGENLRQRSKGEMLPVDICEEMIKLVFDILGKTILSSDLNCVANMNGTEAYLYRASTVVTDSLKDWVKNPIFYIKRFIPFINRRYWHHLKGYNKYVYDMVLERRSRFLQDPSLDAQDFVDILSKATLEPVKNPSSGEMVKLTIKQAVDNLKLAIFAGHDTTAITTSWGIYLLAKHPDVVHALRRELSEEDDNNTLLDCVVLEILRLYPPGMFFKEPTVDLELGEYIIPKGSEIMLNPFLLQRDDRYYLNPHKFLPSRWKPFVRPGKSLSLTLLKISKDLPFVAFSLGPRNCIGKNLALMQMKQIVQAMVMGFELSLPTKMPSEFQEFPYMGLTMLPRGCQVNLKPLSTYQQL